MTDEEDVDRMCELFNSMMPERLHIGRTTQWKPEHRPNAVWNKKTNQWEDVK